MSESNASIWQTLLPAAMVGTDKMAVSSPTLSGPVGALLAQIQAQAASPALALLQTAGVLAVCERAARQGTPTLDADAAAPAPNVALDTAAPETAPALTSKNLHLSLRWALTEGALRLQVELLQRLNAAGLRLPYSLLTLALEAGQRSVALRPALLAVLGERGRWLARQNSAWRFAEGGTAADAPLETRWSDGSLTQRVALLREERQRDPASARERLKTALPDLPAKERAELAAVLIEGLSMDDEALLTALCKDRGGDVRQTARALLVQLPDSATTQRAIARLLPCLEKPKWAIDAPPAASDDWKADGIEIQIPKYERLGERAWWLYQLARQVPLAWWESHTGMAPAALLQWARKSDWTEALARAWLDVLRSAPNIAWCQAFLDHWPGKAAHENPAAILALLPPAQREPYWMQALQSKEALHASFIQVAGQIVQACPAGAHISLPLSEFLIDTLQNCLRDAAIVRHAYEFSNHLPELCCVLHPGALPAWQALPRLDNEPSWLTNALDRCLQPIAARLAFANPIHPLAS